MSKKRTGNQERTGNQDSDREYTEEEDIKRFRIDLLLNKQEELNEVLSVLNEETPSDPEKKRKREEIEGELKTIADSLNSELNNPDLSSSEPGVASSSESGSSSSGLAASSSGLAASSSGLAASSSGLDSSSSGLAASSSGLALPSLEQQQQLEQQVKDKLLAKCKENTEKRKEQTEFEKKLLDELEIADPSLKNQLIASKPFLGELRDSSSEMDKSEMGQENNSDIEFAISSGNLLPKFLSTDENLKEAADISVGDVNMMDSEARSTTTENPEQQKQEVNWIELCGKLEKYINEIIDGTKEIYNYSNFYTLLYYYLKHCLNTPDKYKLFIRKILDIIKDPHLNNKEVVFEILRKSLSAYPEYYPNVNNSFLLHEIFYFLRESNRMLNDENFNMDYFDSLIVFVNTLIVLFTFYDGSLMTIEKSIENVRENLTQKFEVELKKCLEFKSESGSKEEEGGEGGEEEVDLNCTNLDDICNLLNVNKSISFILKCLSDKIDPTDTEDMEIGSPASDNTEFFIFDENLGDFDEIIKFLTLFLTTLDGIESDLKEKIKNLLCIAKLTKYKNLLKFFKDKLDEKKFLKDTLDEIVDYKIENIDTFVNYIFYKLHEFTEHEIFILLQMMHVRIQLEFENYTDLLLSVITESNREYVQIIEHCMNVQSYMNSMLEVYENLEVYERLLVGQIPGRLELFLSQQASNEPFYVTTSTGEIEQRGGADTDFCAGMMDEIGSDDDDVRFNLKRQGYCALGCSKLYDELKHDFKPYLKGLMPKIESIYKKVINFFHIKLVEDNKSHEYPEVKDVVEFMDLVSSYSVGKDPEWNYYTSVLKFMDEKCDNIDELTIVKVVNLADYKNLNVDQVDSDYKRKLGDSEYLYMTMECGEVSPIFELPNLWVSVEDNSTPHRKLWPLVYQNPTPEQAEVESFKRSFFTIDNGPGMLDPKTTGPVSIANFSVDSPFIEQVKGGLEELGYDSDIIGKHITKLQTIQALQNINVAEDQDSKTNMITGLNLFLGYFGVPLNPSPVTNIQFIQTLDGLRFMGINITMENGTFPTFPIHIGDTTISTISSFVKEYDGNIPVDTNDKWDPSWRRLHVFAKEIYANIPANIKANLGSESEVLTMIILSLKSLGDLWQVFYSKKLAKQIEDSGFTSYISSTDKNVGSECFLTSNKFMLNGTGVRPHLKLLEDPELLRFFGKENFRRALVGEDAVPDERDIDGSDTITTNLKVATSETYISSINVTLSKIIPHLDDNVPVLYELIKLHKLMIAYDEANEKANNELSTELHNEIIKIRESIGNNPKFQELYQNQHLPESSIELKSFIELLSDQVPEAKFVEFVDFEFSGVSSILFLILSKKVLNVTGKQKLQQYLDELKKDSIEKKLEIFKNIDIFLKKIYEVIKLTEPDTTTPPLLEVQGVPVEEMEEEMEEEMKEEIVQENVPLAQGVLIPQELQVLGVELQKKVVESTFFQKIKTLTSFLKCNFIASFDALRSKKTKTFNDVDILKHAISIERKSREAVKKVNIFDKKLLDFARDFMEHDYQHVLDIATTAYDNLLSSTQVEIEEIALELVSLKEEVRKSTRERTQRVDQQDTEINFALAQASENAKMQEFKKKIEESKDCIYQLIQSMEKQNNKREVEKIKNKLDKQRTSLEKLQQKLNTEVEEQKRAIADKIKNKFDKNNPEKSRKNMSSMLKSMANTFGNFLGVRSQPLVNEGGKLKKRKTRKNIKKINKKTIKTNKRRSTKRNKTIQKDRKKRNRNRKTRKN